MTDTPDIEAAVDALSRAVTALVECGDPDITAGTLDEAVERYEATVSAIAALRPIVDALSIRLVDDLPGESYGPVRRTTDRRSAWVDKAAQGRLRDDLAAAVALSVALNPVKGEIDAEARTAALLGAGRALRAIGSFSNVLQAARDEYGIDLSIYRTWSDVNGVALDTGAK